MQLQHVQLPRWALATLRCTPHVLPGEGGAEGTERIGSLGGLLSLCSCSNNILQLVGPPLLCAQGRGLAQLAVHLPRQALQSEFDIWCCLPLCQRQAAALLCWNSRLATVGALSERLVMTLLRVDT